MINTNDTEPGAQLIWIAPGSRRRQRVTYIKPCDDGRILISDEDNRIRTVSARNCTPISPRRPAAQ